MKRRGFTLIEIAVAIAILTVLLSIALPRFSQMMIVANETSIIEAMRAVVLACESWKMRVSMTPGGRTWTRVPGSLEQLTTADPPYLDSRFQRLGIRRFPWRGYILRYSTAGGVRTITVGDQTYNFIDGYVLTANPWRRGVTGQRSFYVDQTGVIRFHLSAPAGPNDPPIERESQG